MNKHCPCCGAEIVPGQQYCANCLCYVGEDAYEEGND